MSDKDKDGIPAAEADDELQDDLRDASETEALQHAINNLTIDELEAVVRARGMENDPSVMRSLEGIRKGAKVDALERAVAENRDPSMED